MIDRIHGKILNRMTKNRTRGIKIGSERKRKKKGCKRKNLGDEIEIINKKTFYLN